MASGSRSRRIAIWTLGGILALYVCLIGVKVLWPLRFEDEVRTAAAVQQLDLDLVLAVIFAESRFDPEAVSPVGAAGLMQIMPESGRWIAEQIPLAQPEAIDLFDPVLNVRLGTWYLRYLLDRFGDVEAALAAYNAGPTRVDRWLAEDQAPFAETAAFVRRVLAARRVYRVYMSLSGLLRYVPSLTF